MNNLQICEIGPKDITAILPLLSASRYKPYRFFSKGLESEINKFWLNRIEKTVLKTESNSMVALSSNKIVGFILIEPLPWDSNIFNKKMGSITELIIDANQNEINKISYMLVKKAQNWVQSKNYDFILCKTFTDDSTTIHTLEKEGFLLVDTILDYCIDFRKNPFSEIDQQVIKKDIAIRQATMKDEIQLERLAEASFKNHFGRYHSDPRIPLEKAIQVYVEWMRSCIRGYADFILVAEIDKRIAGVSTWKKSSILEKDLPLRISHYNIGAVHPDFSGMGLFSNLTYAGMQIFKDSADIIEGPTHVNNYPVQRGYQRLGWQVFDARHSFHKWLKK